MDVFREQMYDKERPILEECLLARYGLDFAFTLYICVFIFIYSANACHEII